jgi:ATP-dependent DNA helicase RecQ
LLGCTNGYEFIKVTKNSEASHLGGKARGDISNISISDSQIKDKTIYLFDDVITSGKTFVALANALREAGAKEVIGFFLAKTYDSRRLGEPNW